MKKMFLIAMVAFVAVAMVGYFSSQAMAAVGGVCSNCHTMHYSQGGAIPTGAGTTGPYETLLLNDCLGCHTTSAGDPLDNVNNTPYVMDTGSAFNDDKCLAGGFFPSAMGTGSNDDDHHGVTSAQTNPPAGYDAFGGFNYTGAANGLGCAGSNGCHGNETDVSDMAAIAGGHHNTSSTYRMLYVGGAAVIGSPAEDYEELMISTPATTPITSGAGQNVNIYSAGDGDVTISELCGKCHGDFHGATNTNAASPFIRHPTDIDIPSGWAIASDTYNPDGDDYKNNPVGYAGATVNSAAKRATCLSCHRAHGTENADLLRWDYATQVAGGVTVEYGCLGCHDAQR